MDLNVSTVLSFNPETQALFNRLHDDARRLSGDIKRLQRFVELAMAKSVVAPAFNPVAKEQDLDSWLQEDEWQKADSLSAFVDGFSTDTSPAPTPAPVPEPSASEPVEMESSARQRLKDDADATAQRMVAGFDLMKQQGQSTATSLAYALRVAREASAGFECPRMMKAILTVLDWMDAAARKEQSNG